MDGHRQAAARYTQALERTAPQRQELDRRGRELADALTETRPDRVLAAACGDPAGKHLETVLGPAPCDPGSWAVWCAIANEIEAQRDRASRIPGRAGTGQLGRLLGGRPTYTTKEWDRVAGLVNDAPALLEIASTNDRSADALIEDPRLWRAALDRNVKVIDAARAALEPEPVDVGMELGW